MKVLGDEILTGCIARVRGSLSSLRPSEQKVATIILKMPNEVIHWSVGEIAKECDVSEATIIRFCQNIGYSGFQNLKMSLAQEVAIPTQFIPQQITPEDELATIVSKVAHANSQAIKDTTNIVDVTQLEAAVKIIDSARRVELYGVGFSGLVAQDASIRLNRIGIPAITHVDSHLQATSAALLNNEDVAIGISLLGRTVDVLYSLKQAKNAGATVIAVTKYAKNPIADLADLTLHISTEDEAFRTGASRIAQLHLVDIIYASLAVYRYEKSLDCMRKTKHIGLEKRV